MADPRSTAKGHRLPYSLCSVSLSFGQTLPPVQFSGAPPLDPSSPSSRSRRPSRRLIALNPDPLQIGPPISLSLSNLVSSRLLFSFPAICCNHRSSHSFSLSSSSLPLLHEPAPSRLPDLVTTAPDPAPPPFPLSSSSRRRRRLSRAATLLLLRQPLALSLSSSRARQWRPGLVAVAALLFSTSSLSPSPPVFLARRRHQIRDAAALSTRLSLSLGEEHRHLHPVLSLISRAPSLSFSLTVSLSLFKSRTHTLTITQTHHNSTTAAAAGQQRPTRSLSSDSLPLFDFPSPLLSLSFLLEASRFFSPKYHNVQPSKHKVQHLNAHFKVHLT